MRILRSTSIFFTPAILIAIGLGLVGCSAPTTTGPDPGTETPTSATTDGSGTSTDGSSTPPWDACPAIVASLNGNADDPTDYKQIDPAGFAVQEVGSDVLAGACVIELTINAEILNWAILRGNAALAESIKADLLAAGFEDGGLILGNSATGQGVLVASFANGAALDKYLVYPTAFAPYDEELIYIGTFTLE